MFPTWDFLLYTAYRLFRRTIKFKNRIKEQLFAYFQLTGRFLCVCVDYTFVLLLLRFYLENLEWFQPKRNKILLVYEFLSSSEAYHSSCVINTLWLATNISCGSVFSLVSLLPKICCMFFVARNWLTAVSYQLIIYSSTFPFFFSLVVFHLRSFFFITEIPASQFFFIHIRRANSKNGKQKYEYVSRDQLQKLDNVVSHNVCSQKYECG